MDTIPDVQASAREAGKELRRLHKEVKEWEKVCDQHLRYIKKLKKQLEKANEHHGTAG
jgi:DnaJ-domain-containing protein 1